METREPQRGAGRGLVAGWSILIPENYLEHHPKFSARALLHPVSTKGSFLPAWG